MKKNEASVAVCKCSTTHRLFGVRFEKIDRQWFYTWAFALKESTARSEGYDRVQIKGNIMPANDYPGCPYCGSNGFVICRNCEKLSCMPVASGLFTCEWCETTGMLTSYDGSGFNSYEDR